MVPRFLLLLASAGLLCAADATFSISDAKTKQAVADAVVSLMPLDAAITPAGPAAQVEIIQRGEQFTPYVTPVRIGTSVHFPNRDKVKHQVYSTSEAKEFVIPLYAGEAKDPIVFDRPGVVAIGCNIHDWMVAYVVVLETPWFAKTDADGKAVVAGVPAGRYRATVWQPRLNPETSVSTEITLANSVPAPIAFTLDLEKDKRRKRGLDLKSGGYK